MTTQRDQLRELYVSLLRACVAAVRDMEITGQYEPAMLNLVRNFLRDNGIHIGGTNQSVLNDLGELLRAAGLLVGPDDADTALMQLPFHKAKEVKP